MDLVLFRLDGLKMLLDGITLTLDMDAGCLVLMSAHKG
jgi:hypothetical protein